MFCKQFTKVCSSVWLMEENTLRSPVEDKKWTEDKAYYTKSGIESSCLAPSYKEINARKAW